MTRRNVRLEGRDYWGGRPLGAYRANVTYCGAKCKKCSV